MPLTYEQQQFATENHNLIYSFLRKENLSIDEFYDVAAIGFVKAVSTYDPNKSKFSTYAYINMKRAVSAELRKSYAKRRQAVIVQSDNPYEYLESKYDIESDVLLKLQYAELEGEEKYLVDSLLMGKTRKEIAIELGVSQSTINNRIKKISGK